MGKTYCLKLDNGADHTGPEVASLARWNVVAHFAAEHDNETDSKLFRA